MRAATLTLNPAIDQTIELGELRPGEVNRARHARLQAGGKGVNVAAALAHAGLTVAVTGFLGVENPAVHERYFRDKGLEDRFVRIPGETRTNVKLVDREGRRTTDVNLPGMAPSDQAVDQLIATLTALTGECEWFALCGALSPGLPVDFYAQIIRALERLGRPAALDTSGEALRRGVKARPAVIKPNLEELEQLTGVRARSPQEAISAALPLLEDGIATVIVSMGAQGALFIRPGEALWAQSPVTARGSTVGAGDALLAGWLAGELKGMDQKDRCRIAVAFAAAAVMRTGADYPPYEEIQALAEQVGLTSPSWPRR